MGSLFFLSSKSVNSSSHFSFSTPSAAAGRQTKERALSLPPLPPLLPPQGPSKRERAAASCGRTRALAETVVVVVPFTTFIFIFSQTHTHSLSLSLSRARSLFLVFSLYFPVARLSQSFHAALLSLFFFFASSDNTWKIFLPQDKKTFAIFLSIFRNVKIEMKIS